MADEVGERFDRYMARCLYGPDGFYASTGTAGRSRGDFITSPEVGPLFGAVIANVVDRWWEALGRPDPLKVYDVGCGPGTLLKSVRLARPDRPWELIGVDVVTAAGADSAELPGDLSGAVVLGNELLDNLPFRIVTAELDEPAEVFVHGDPPAERLVAADVPLSVAAGKRAPYLEEANRWVTSVLNRNPAVLCLLDYGAPTTAELVDRGGWLRTYRAHQRGSDPLVTPGLCDITTDVAWDQLPTPDSLVSQAEFLRAGGIQDLVDEGRQFWNEHAAAPDLTAIRMRSRVAEAKALLDEDGLGGWWVGTWVGTGIGTGVGTESPDRR